MTAVFFLILIFLSLYFCDEMKYDSRDDFQFSLHRNGEYLTISFQNQFNGTNGWIAIGFSLSKNMFFSDVSMGWYDPAGGHCLLIDGHIEEKRQFKIDTQRDIEYIDCLFRDGILKIDINRKLNTTDEIHDIDLGGNGDIYVIWAYSDEIAHIGDDVIIPDHIQRGVLQTNLYDFKGYFEIEPNPFYSTTLHNIHGALSIFSFLTLMYFVSTYPLWGKKENAAKWSCFQIPIALVSITATVLTIGNILYTYGYQLSYHSVSGYSALLLSLLLFIVEILVNFPCCGLKFVGVMESLEFLLNILFYILLSFVISSGVDYYIAPPFSTIIYVMVVIWLILSILGSVSFFIAHSNDDFSFIERVKYLLNFRTFYPGSNFEIIEFENIEESESVLWFYH
eukprot:TRINITY_DN5152_c0_g1_i1.p1 TRINITY_DN5152_c0_g1~~TRINITY_DN5152_c0_g1_i1.p1  ORF type:complete len:394 (+),score=56.54 TRINITY_DN5152_c0_g1_i1:25-1206(+)